METDPEKNFIAWRVRGLCLFKNIFAHSAVFIRFSHLFHLFLSYLCCFYSLAAPPSLCHTHKHPHSLCDEFDMIFHSGRRLGLMWSWAPEFPSNEFFYYASLHPLQGYSLTAMWSCVNTKSCQEYRHQCMCMCVCVCEREKWGLLQACMLL